MPLQEVSGGGDGDDETGAPVFYWRAAEDLCGRLGAGPGELNEELSPTAKQRSQQGFPNSFEAYRGLQDQHVESTCNEESSQAPAGPAPRLRVFVFAHSRPETDTPLRALLSESTT